MTTGIKSWSKTAASNNAAVPNGAPEGWAPSAVNAVVRQIMAEVRTWYEDPAWTDFGYTTAYVATTQFKTAGVDTTSVYVVGRRVRASGSSTGLIYGTITVSAFSTDTTVTVSWDSGTLANETLTISVGLPSLGSPIAAGAVAAGTPAGSIVAYGGTTAPSGWLLCYGQAVSRTTYAGLFTAIASIYGDGDTSTTFNVPDLRGRAIAGQDDMGGSSANRLTGVSGGIDGDVLGGTGGEEAHALTSGELAAHTHDGSSLTAASGGAHTHTATTSNLVSSGAVMVATVQGGTVGSWTSDSGGAHTHTVSGNTGSTGSGTAHNVVQPTIILNYIIKT